MKILSYIFMVMLCLCTQMSRQGINRKYDIGDIGLTFLEFHNDGTGKYSTVSEYINEDGSPSSYASDFTYIFRQQDGLSYIDITSSPLPYYSGLYDSIQLLSSTEIRDGETRNLAIGYAVSIKSGKTELFIHDWTRAFDGAGRTYYDCSSFLVERTKSYPVKNLCSIEDASPWVEAAPGPGIDEGFTIEHSKGKMPYLLIMNGYISCTKPYLYKQNARVKQVKVTGTESGRTKLLDVLDTPNPQTVDISFLDKEDDVRVTIADVYPGTKYEDTCLSFCVTYPYQVLPDREPSFCYCRENGL
mgnify:CR=1 FL=1